LYSIATNACLRAIERRPKRVLPIDYGPPADPHDELPPAVESTSWIEPFAAVGPGPSAPDARYEWRESIELAFVAALQHLSGRQRAVLILRDVLGFSAREVAAMLESSPPAIDSALQRAHRTVEERLPSESQQRTLRALGDERLKALVGAYVDAWERADVKALAALLTEDARVTMPPIPAWFVGRDAVIEFFQLRVLTAGAGRRRLVPIEASGVPAFGQYIYEHASGVLEAHAIVLLSLRGERFADLTAFLEPRLFPHFGLPAELQMG
ncbi:MAG: RNA polymerase subunit sigma-70, partial [Solirubrobacteraceae bacterium]